MLLFIGLVWSVVSGSSRLTLRAEGQNTVDASCCCDRRRRCDDAMLGFGLANSKRRRWWLVRYAVMVVVQAAKLDLSPYSSSVSSFLFDPYSLSLALRHFDSSFSLYPSLSPFSISSANLPPPQTLVPSPSSSAAFLRLRTSNPTSTPRVVFVVAAPLRAGAAVLLQFWILRKSQSFARARVVCRQRGLAFDGNKSGVVFDVNHGVSVKLAGSINVFAMYSVSNCKIWVFTAKLVGDEEDGLTVKLMKCAVIDCIGPVYAINVSFGFLMLGEERGVRVFPLRPLVNGRVRKHRPEKKNLTGGLNNYKLLDQRLTLPNGTADLHGSHLGTASKYGVNGCGSGGAGGGATGEGCSNGYWERKTDKHYDCVKLRSVKLREDSKDGGVFFAAFESNEVGSFKSTTIPLKSVKAISVEALSPNKFLILDSVGNLHVLCLLNAVLGSEVPFQVKRLSYTMKVQGLAVLPDTSIRSQTVWISDGHHTVHVMTFSDTDTSVKESDRKDSEGNLTQISVIQAIFNSEKIQDIIPLAANAILILGQGSIYAYEIS